MGDGFLHFFEELSQPQLYMQSIVILERAVRSLKAVVGGGETILKTLKPIPKVRIYPGLLDIFNYFPQLLSMAVVVLEEGPCIFELCWTCGKLQDKEVPPESVPPMSMLLTPSSFLSTFLTTCAQHIALGHSGKAILLTAVIVGEPSAITKRGAN